MFFRVFFFDFCCTHIAKRRKLKMIFTSTLWDFLVWDENIFRQKLLAVWNAKWILISGFLFQPVFRINKLQFTSAVTQSSILESNNETRIQTFVGSVRPSLHVTFTAEIPAAKTSFSLALHGNVVNLLYLNGLSVFTTLTYQIFYDVDTVALPIVYAPHYLLLTHQDF